MPLYLVRWPDHTGAFVNAANEDQLLDILDEVANPEGCTWSVYRGPFHLEFKLNAEVKDTRTDDQLQRPLGPQDFHIGDVQRICEGDPLTIEIADADTGSEMTNTVLRTIFPALQKVREGADDQGPREEDVRAALRTDLELLVQASWRRHQTKRRPDQDSQIATQMGTDPRLVEYWAKATRAAVEREKPSAPATRKKKATRSKPPSGKKPPPRSPRKRK